ncbi:aliphatic sulfonates import ATP-binding protein SsuB 1 [Polycladomyces abyssicola]|jgi:sulfonate transport system ATP-binding protein|uniref:Aliphatic sulfonates import ATP-binding protein SsuB 1 n=1 Tax=Polycladomyces abyssicola TaxID=1125966 RepID=A0A8D5ZQ61_9BACL|nr:ATP-binding cassette domain-containing protein [Polycladomyces abyssicola]BCU83013.1 aliphatic sulfonates import ATP-binding protein SsuB 1 [Polycladomyces abyssicola]
MAKMVSGARLEIEGLQKRFGDRLVLRHIHLHVKPGEFVAIVGRSGCGKSTLLRLIAGLETPTVGGIALDGDLVRGLNPSARVMFQEHRLLPWLTVADNVALGVSQNREEVEKRTAEALRQVGLAEYGGEWPAVLSGGQRQRVALARALVSRPRLLLLDEPLGALDALTKIEMQQLIEQLWQEQGFTALLVTHDVEEAVALADRVVLLEDGRIAMDLPIVLPRPRHRGSAKFASLVGTILDRLMKTVDAVRHSNQG